MRKHLIPGGALYSGISSKYSGQWRLRVPKSLHAALALKAKLEGVSLNILSAVLLAEGLEHQIHLESEGNKRHGKHY